MTTVNDLGHEELVNLVARERWAKEVLAQRVAAVLAENADLHALNRELQMQLSAVSTIRQNQEVNGDPPT